MATSTPIISERPLEWPVEWASQIGASQVLRFDQGPFIHLEPHRDLFEDGFSHSLQVAATEFQKLREPKVAKLKGGYSSDANLVFQTWLKDIWVYVLEHHLSQWDAIQLVKDYTSEHAQLKVEYYLGMTPKSEQSFQGLVDHLSLAFQCFETIRSLIGDVCKQSHKVRRLRTHSLMTYKCW